MCRLFVSFNNKNTKQIILNFLKQSIQYKKNTPGIDNYRDQIKHIDGYGLGWFSNNKWKIHKYHEIYTKDTDFDDCLEKMSKKLVLGNIRKKNTEFQK